MGAAISEAFSVTLFNAVLFALWAILPGLCIGYTRQAIAARRIRPDFSLRRLESIELDRAMLIYEKVSNRLKEIDRLGSGLKGSLRSRYRRRAQIRQQCGEELEDLTAYAHHLRAMIIRIRRRPIQRFMARVHIISSRFAFSYSLALYVATLAFLVATIYLSEQTVWAQDLTTNIDTLLIWKPVDERLIYANGIAAGLVVIATPVFYLVRRTTLHIEQRSQIRSLKEFAGTDPDGLIHHPQDSQPDTGDPQEPTSVEPPGDSGWYSVLELSPAATIEEVKEAYKFKIKQHHPDRVHGMAVIFRDLAEEETKKLNAAYEEALVSLRPFECGCEASRS